MTKLIAIGTIQVKEISEKILVFKKTVLSNQHDISERRRKIINAYVKFCLVGLKLIKTAFLGDINFVVCPGMTD